MRTVIDTGTRTGPLRGMPAMPHEVAAGELRLILLPPGQVDVALSLDRHLIDVNLNAGRHRLAVDSDRLRDGEFPVDSISLWPK